MSRRATTSNIELKEVYSAKDLDKDFEQSLGKPGEHPFTRGIHSSMYRGKPWTMRQYAGFGTAKESNKRYHYLLSQGTTGLSVAFDLPTQMGRDSDHPLAQAEVGKVGVAISSIEDMEVLLDRIPLEQVSISMTINATASTLLAFLLVVAERRGISWDKLNGTTQNDILKEYIARGTFIYPPRPGLKLVVDLSEFCSKAVPNWNTVSISGYHIREAGSTAVEEVAFTLADGLTYVEALRARGLGVDEFAPRLAFFFNCHNNFLEEVAKFRAARRLWARLMKERFNPKNPKSCMLRFHTQTAGSSLTAQQPLNNVVRTTVQALAAVLGGTQSLHTNSFDEALGLPTEESATVALRTQQILASESGVADIVDPFGGSFAIESLTDTIEQEALKRIELLDAKGGMLRAIEEGFPQSEIEKSAYEYQQKIESGESKIVGVNCYQAPEAKEMPVYVIDRKAQEAQIKSVQKLKASRAQPPVEKALKELNQSARDGKNLMPAILDAVRVKVTLGEISDCLRSVFGEHNNSTA